MTSDYWTEVDPVSGYDVKVRVCKNDGCKEVVHFDEDQRRFIVLHSGEIHNCPFYKKTSGSRGPSQAQAQSSETQPNQSNNEEKQVQILGNIYEVIEASRQLLKQLVESQQYFEKLLEVRYKELRKDDPDTVYTEEQLAEMASEKRGLPN